MELSHVEGRPVLDSVPLVEYPRSNSSKQAACLTCRRSKTRCLRGVDDVQCNRCQQAGTGCVIPEYHVGRQKGVKNKQPGLDKAVRRLEQAIERSRAGDGQLRDEATALQLQELLNKSQGLLSSAIASEPVQVVQTRRPRNNSRSQTSYYTQNQNLATECGSSEFSGRSAREDSSALDDAENPLQLLARASNLPSADPLSIRTQHQQSGAALHPQMGIMTTDKGDSQDLRVFFGPLTSQLDVGEEIDPIDMGFVTLDETDILFSFFYQNLSHTRWGLDPALHTPNFVRSRSAFLFTSILAASSLFLPSTAALSKRLSAHCKRLANLVTVNRNRSPEIVLAFMINIPWMSPGKHWTDDETCSYMAMALTVAVDLSLNKVVVPCQRLPQVNLESVPKSECISAKRALALDGFNDVESNSLRAKRLLRSRERIWLALFVLDRGVCLARGRSYTVPVTLLVETCDNWHISDISDTWDGSIISSGVMRKELPRLIADIRTICDRDNLDNSSIVETLNSMIGGFFDRWYSTWAFSIEGSQENVVPPYVEILVTHARLSIYSSVINHPTAPPSVSRFFRSAGLSSALNVMRAAVQGESQLKSMPNNTAIMISFAACFALLLTSTNSEGSANGGRALAPSIRSLVYETADVLERIGNIPLHRKGASALYGRHLRQVVKNTASSTDRTQSLLDPNDMQGGMGSFRQAGTGLGLATSGSGNSGAMVAFEPLIFSAMSDHQIIEAIDNAGDELETYLPPFQIDERTAIGSDWLNWFSLDDMA